MNRTTAIYIIAALALLGAARLHSHAEAARNAAQNLQSIKEQNQKQIDQQAATLTKLDDLAKDADQLRAFAKRS